jgi:glycogen debranching enzyme
MRAVSLATRDPTLRVAALDGGDVVVHADGAALRSAPDGSITRPDHGLFDGDARLLCRYLLTLDGIEPQLVAASVVDDERWLATAIHPLEGGTPEGPRLPQDCVAIQTDRAVGPGMTDRVTFTNHGATQVRLRLRLEIASDLTDLLDLGREGTAPRPLDGAWEAATGVLTFIRSLEGPMGTAHRTARVHVSTSGSPAWDGSALAMPLELEPGAQARLEVVVAGDGAWDEARPIRNGRPMAHPVRRAAERAAWRSTRTRVTSEPPLFGMVVDQAIEDLFALRARTFEGTNGGWVLNAGIPQFTGLFGRDVLTAGWQAAMAGPEALLGALEAVARTQARDDDPFRDAEPGKLIHEMRRGPLVQAGVSPRDAYYGSQTVPAMFVLALSEAWHWTGDDGLLERFVGIAERATAWAEGKSSERDGLLWYRTRSSDGLRNQGWKDSDEAIRYPDGRLVPVPIATVEEQAFHTLALERLAEIHLALGDEGLADRELALAADHRRHWHDTFWREELGFYAMAIDPDGQPVDTIGSNAGHALGTGGIPRRLAGRVAARMLEPDLFSGFGVRTLSARHPSFNPFAYHLGSVWPVENATFILGAKRYGLDDTVERLVEGLVAAAAAAPALRLPEALSGLDRAAWPVPVRYPAANAPQAWSASATVQLAQAITGLYPFAPIRLAALVRPRLPSWLDVLRIDRLRIGKSTMSIRFERRADGSASHDVIERDGPLTLIEVQPPQAADLGPLDEAASWVLEHAPGATARILRIALGLEAERLAEREPRSAEAPA